jgi:hypothetical protein
MSKAPRACSALILTMAATAGAVISVAHAQQRPDFTGVYEGYRDPSQGRASGFGGTRASLPLTEEGKRLVAEYQTLAGPTRLNGATFCADYGVPTVMTLPGAYPIEFIQKPDQLTIIYEVNNEVRRIYIGDRQVEPNRRLPSRAGYSAGHWEGNVLVVKTTDLLDAQDQGSPFSDQATIDERFLLDEANGKKILTYQATITDPVYYTEPVKLPDRKYQLYDGFIIPYGCQDEIWYELLDLRRQQLKAGKPVEARMSDVYKVREDRE